MHFSTYGVSRTIESSLNLMLWKFVTQFMVVRILNHVSLQISGASFTVKNFQVRIPRQILMIILSLLCTVNVSLSALVLIVTRLERVFFIMQYTKLPAAFSEVY